MADIIKVTVLEDGTIKTETDAVSMPNHQNAEAFLRDVGKLAGGLVERKQKHGHTHTHGTITHSH